MSVLIKGMEIPKSCCQCPCSNVAGCEVTREVLTSNLMRTGRSKRCPLVLVPFHGRLIDASVAYDKIAEQEGGNYVDMDAVGMGLDETPTVIPASEED